jgi:hypothetical protein
MKPGALATLQQQFQDYLLQASPDGGAIGAAIASQPQLPAADRLAIYYKAYRIRLREALDDAFAKTGLYLGDELFAEVCEGFVASHPSTVRNLRWYGRQFSAFLAQELEQHPQVAELAAFEWALGMAFDAEDAPVLCADDLRHLAPEDWAGITFTVHPSVQMLDMNCNAVAIWQALDKDDAPPDPVHGAGHWLVWRNELRPQFRSMNDVECRALRGLQLGSSFAEVCAAAAAAGANSNPAAQLAACLRTWLDDAVLSGFCT